MKLSERIKAARTAKRISQFALGVKVGIHPQSMSDIERGKRNVPPHFAPALARELDIDPGVLQAAMQAFEEGGELGNAGPA